MGQVGAAAEGGHLLRPNKEASAGTGPWGSCSGDWPSNMSPQDRFSLWGPQTAQLAKSNGRGCRGRPTWSTDYRAASILGALQSRWEGRCG